MTTKNRNPTSRLVDETAGALDDERVALAAERERLQRMSEAAKLEMVQARQVRLAAEVDQLLSGELSGRVTPGHRRTGIRDLLITLKADPVEVRLADPLAVQLAESSDRKLETSAYDILVAFLRATPEFVALGQGELAASDDGAMLAGDTRSAEQRAVDRRMGISDERAIELSRRRDPN